MTLAPAASRTLEEFRRSLPVAPRRLLDSLGSIDSRHLLRLSAFAAIYGSAATAAVAIGSAAAPAFWFATLPLHFLAAAALHGISLFTHEGVHDTLAASPLANRLLALACALPVLQTFTAYRVLHLRHHDDTGGAIDPDHYDNYARSRILVFLMHWTRLLIGYPIYLVAIPILGLRHGGRRDRLWILSELALLACAAWGVSWIPGPVLLHAWAIPMLFVNLIVNVRGMSQHTLLAEPHHRIRGTRTILASPLVAFFFANENYHLEHHLYPRVPWYNLPRLHQALEPELREDRAPFIPSYLSFVRAFARESIRWLRST